MEDSSKGIKENDRKQEQPTQDFGKKHVQDLKKINHSMKSIPISTHSINGSYGYYSTMKLIGEYDKNRELNILVDSGSTNNILDISVAKSLDFCKMTKMVYPQSLSVANGEKILCSMEWLDFEWSMQNQNFKSDFLCIPLSGCEMVLGIPWLITLGDILWNFSTLVMWFFREQKYQYLHGIQGETTSEYEISEKELAEAFLDFN